MRLAIDAGMRRILGAALAIPLVTLAVDAHATGAWVPSAGQSPIEQRVAVAVGPARTTLWTSFRFEGSPGPVGLVIPVPPEAALDLSSDAWFEALNVATAPRVLPPSGVDPYCPGDTGEPGPFDIAGSTEHEPTIAPSEVAILADAQAALSWAAARGLALSPEAQAQLGAAQGRRFFAALFDAPAGAGLTKTLRIAMDGGEPLLPLALTRAVQADLTVTAWLLGGGRAALRGAEVLRVPGSDVTWHAAALESDYEDERTDALTETGASGAVLECSSHDALSRTRPVGASTIEGVVTAYYERARAYGDVTGDAPLCAASAAAALASSAVVATSCPRADYGVVDGSSDCAESPSPAETDPNRLRCGAIADDLAVALSGAVPSQAWLSRYTLRIAAGRAGADWPLAFEAGDEVSPTVRAGALSLEACESAPSGGASSGSASGGSDIPVDVPPSNPPPTDDPDVVVVQPIVESGCDCSGTADTAVIDGSGGWYDDETSGPADSAYEDDGCSGDTSESQYEDDGCSGDTSESQYEDDGCSGDTSESQYEDDGCSGDSTTDATGGDACSSDSSGTSSESCSSDSAGSGEACSVAGVKQPSARRKRPPKLSPLLLGALAVLAPLRRASRPRRGSHADPALTRAPRAPRRSRRGSRC